MGCKRKHEGIFASRKIKKIMQSDEEVGKMAKAVPFMVSKAVELFLQDLLSKTYQITLQSGSKAVSASHLKACVHSYPLFDFLRDRFHSVPDMHRNSPLHHQNLPSPAHTDEEKHPPYCLELNAATPSRGTRSSKGRRRRSVTSPEDCFAVAISGTATCRGRGRVRPSVAQVDASLPHSSEQKVGLGAIRFVKDFDLNVACDPSLDEETEEPMVQAKKKESSATPVIESSFHPASEIGSASPLPKTSLNSLTPVIQNSCSPSVSCLRPAIESNEGKQFAYKCHQPLRGQSFSIFREEDNYDEYEEED